jgi:hypothetical protein
MGENVRQVVGSRGGKVREDPKPFLDVEKEENGCAVAGVNEFHSLMVTAR